MRNDFKKLKFERRPAPVQAEHRPLYKIGQILLILQLASRGGRSSLPRLHLFNWALKRAERKSLLLRATEVGELKVFAWGFDPALAIALNYASEERVLELGSSGVLISELGVEYVSKICVDRELFQSEREFLVKIGKSITEGMVVQASRNWEDR